jgi:hypothetical protein
LKNGTGLVNFVQKKNKEKYMKDKVESLKRNNLTRNLFIEEWIQITPHKPNYTGTKKYSL